MEPNSSPSGELVKMEDINANNISTSLALTRISTPAVPRPISSLVPKDERLVTDEMGSEVVQIYIGLGKAEFSIHKQLLLRAGPIFHDMFPPTRKANERVTLGKEEPQVFKLFVEFLYTRQVPSVHPSMALEANGQRLENICKLYAFAEKFRVENTICNRIMDAIQDGFLFLDRLPPPMLVKSIYQNTMYGSKLRAFGIAGLLYSLPMRGTEGVKAEPVTNLLAGSKEALREFVLTLKRGDLLGRDPRVRDCEGQRGCVECRCDRERLRGRIGSAPCRFHIHNTNSKGGARVVKAEGETETSSSSVGISDSNAVEGCYLWDNGP